MALLVVCRTGRRRPAGSGVCRCNQVKEIIYSLDYNFISGNTKASSEPCRRQAQAVRCCLCCCSSSLCCGWSGTGRHEELLATECCDDWVPVEPFAGCVYGRKQHAACLLYIYWLLWQRSCAAVACQSSPCQESCGSSLARQKSIVPIIIMRLLTYWTTKRRSKQPRLQSLTIYTSCIYSTHLYIHI